GLIVAGLLVVYSGLYNVAPRREHLPPVRWLIETTLRRSVQTHSLGIEVPQLAGDHLVRLGAGHFATGCAPCHGAPGRPRSPIMRHMLPSPPPLSEAAARWSPAEQFWIVLNGL